ncbi:Terminase RNaseH-like domain containing protein [uncultured Caudovirales phage]|uniref:Terminase RNaseH-like domain containing protein n=1 Tax=uncultured Caudovirales phage TaxID=2100421 RepID=A0A6J5P005_9CAUD|nr:Terminase RNaseH-like domain containing protein [uncultured Caudovirales phage]
MPLTEAEQLRLAQALYRERFSAFCYRAFSVVNPGEKIEWNWHLDLLCAALESVYRGEIPRIIINMPPRALKSFVCSICFPAWVMGKEPHEKFMVASHTLRPLATKLSNDSRTLIESEWYQSVFPMRLKKATETELYTTQNGHRLTFAALQSPVGMGCNYGILDDVNRPDEALSDVIRPKTNTWLDQNFFSRFNDYRTGKVIVVMQRVHEDDVTGHLLAKGGYYHLKLPAEFKSPPTYTINGEEFKPDNPNLLFPARLPDTVLREKENDLGSYAYAGQFLQSPVPIGGGMFKETWIKWYDPLTYNPAPCNVYILVDPANSKKKSSDWTAMQVVGLAPDNNYYLLDMVRDKFNPTERINKLFELHRKWNARLNKPPKVGYEEYGLASDIHYIEQKQKQDSYNFPIIPLKGKAAKNDRIARLIPDMENGRWYFPEGGIAYTDLRGIRFDLVQELIKTEMMTFPVSKHDDCLDALARVLDEDLEARFPKLIRRSAQVSSYQSPWEF